MTSLARAFRASLLLACSTAALAQSRTFTTPNITTQAGAVRVTPGGQSFVNQGLVGVGRLGADTRDFAGETLGSFSGMALDLGAWRRNADGTCSERVMTLPDRGPNDVGPFVGTTDHRNRVHVSNMTLAPATGTALPQSTASQNQLTITPTGGFFLMDANGQPMTGKDSGAGTWCGTASACQVPPPAKAPGESASMPRASPTRATAASTSRTNRPPGSTIMMPAAGCSARSGRCRGRRACGGARFRFLEGRRAELDGLCCAPWIVEPVRFLGL